MPCPARNAVEAMVTTDRLIRLEAFGSDPPELVHLTGSLQVVALVTTTDSADGAVRLDLSCDAARVRGVGLKSGARYAARGAYRFSDDLGERPISVDLLSAFELLRYEPGDAQPTHLVLMVRFQVAVRTDGRVTAT